MDQIKESDWKILKELKVLALERYCQRVLLDLDRVANATSESFHQRYLRIFKLIQERDDELGLAFDGLSRSHAPMKLVCMRRLALITDEEFSRFSEATRGFVNRCLKVAEGS